MNSLKRFGFPLLGALVVFSMVAGVSPAATVTLADLATVKTYFLNEGAFDHDLLTPLQITISDATWTDDSQGDVLLNESGGGSLSDLVRFVNVGGVATIYFGSNNANSSVALTGPLSGPSPGFTATFTETEPLSSFPGTLTTTSGFSVDGVITSDSDGAGAGAISDHITLQATQAVPEPSTLTLAGLGALGLTIRSLRRAARKH